MNAVCRGKTKAYRLYIYGLLVCYVLLLLCSGYALLLLTCFLSKESRFRMFAPVAYFLIWTFLKLAFIQVQKEYRGDKKLWKSLKQVIVIANHSSYLDSLLIFILFSKSLCPVGKRSFSRIPLLGYLYKKYVITVKRSDAVSRYRCLADMGRAVKRGLSLFIFPEGGFLDVAKRHLNTFNGGAFHMSFKYQIPVVPVIILHTVDRFSWAGRIRITPGRVRIIYLTPVFPHTYSEPEALKDKIYRDMYQILKQENYPYLS